MQTTAEQLEKIGSVSMHGLLIGRFLTGSLIRSTPVINELAQKAQFVVWKALDSDRLPASERLGERLRAERGEQLNAQAADNAEIIATMKDQARHHKEAGAAAIDLAELYKATVEPSRPLEHTTFEDAVVQRQLGQFAVAGDRQE